MLLHCTEMTEYVMSERKFKELPKQK